MKAIIQDTYGSPDVLEGPEQMLPRGARGRQGHGRRHPLRRRSADRPPLARPLR